MCVVCVGARACSLSRSPPRAGVLSQNWIQLYVLNPTFSTPEVRLCTRTHFTHTITHSRMHTTLAILSHITWTYHVKFMFITVWLEVVFRPHSWIMKQWFTLDICTRYVQQDEDSNIFVFCVLSEMSGLLWAPLDMFLCLFKTKGARGWGCLQYLEEIRHVQEVEPSGKVNLAVEHYKLYITTHLTWRIACQDIYVHECWFFTANRRVVGHYSSCRRAVVDCAELMWCYLMLRWMHSLGVQAVGRDCLRIAPGRQATRGL
jgi:hypothetical protein